jgi:hypothetical protein
MVPRLTCRIGLFAGLIFCSLGPGTAPVAHAQGVMHAVVNSGADDADAYAYDDTATVDVDESMDGICRDAQGRCTLRAALEEAAIRGDAADITFDNSVTGITVDPQRGAFSPPKGSKIQGNAGFPVIEGSGPFSFLMGLDSNTTVQGLSFLNATEGIDVGGSFNIIGGSTPGEHNVFLGMDQAAINLIGDHNVVIGNYIGIDQSDNVIGNAFGVFVSNSSMNRIGGSAPGERNIISGNKTGIGLVGDSIDGHLTIGQNVILGNFIGTNGNATDIKPNQIGISAQFSHHLTIGGFTIGERNIISGNTSSGISLGANADTVYIYGNYIGTDYTGVYGLGNQEGIQLGPGSRNCGVAYNLISSNKIDGITISGIEQKGLSSANHLIVGNTIVLNHQHGITIFAKATDNIIGSSLTQDYPENQIQYNGTSRGVTPPAGIFVLGNSNGVPRANTIRKNDFLDNVSRGVVFTQTPVVQDGIAPPVIRVYTVYGDGTALVYGTHPGPGSLIDVYSAGSVAGPTFQGRHWLASGTVDAQGEFSIPMDSCTCGRLIATATDAAGNTSEFSRSFATRPGTVFSNHGSGGNMQSVPVGTSNSSVNSVYPGATGPAYSWVAGPANVPGALLKSAGGSYVPQDTLVHGAGYWLKFSSPGLDSLTGSIRNEDTIHVTSGWNLIGTISDRVAASDIGSIPAGLVASQFFGYTTSYTAVDTLEPGKAYWVRVNLDGSLVLASPDGPPLTDLITIVPDSESPPAPPDQILSVGGHSEPLSYFLREAFPNPFNPSTMIEFGVGRYGFTSLRVYDLLGRELAVLVQAPLQPGRYKIQWNAGNRPSGVYLCRITSGSFNQVRKLLLVR